MGDMWITDLSHFDGVDADAKASRKTKRMAAFFRDIATNGCLIGASPQYVMTRLRCRRRPNRRQCPGRILVRLRTDRQVQWCCSACDDNGLIFNWWGRLADPSSEMGYPLVLEPEVFGVLRHVARDTPVEGRLAELEADAADEREITLSKECLNDLWTLTDVEQAAADDERDRFLLHQLKMALSVAMDGF